LADSVALYDLAGSFLYGVSALDLQKINTFAQRRNYTLHYVFAHLEEAENKHSEFAVLADVIPASRVRIKKLMEDIAYYLDFAKDKRTGEVLYHFIKRSGMLAKFAKEEEREVASLARFFEKVRAFGEVAEKDNVASFVSYLNVLKESGDNPETGMLDEELDAVKVLTVHKAKGLEFRVVFMVSLVADKFPVRFRHQPLELPPSLIKEKRTASDSHLKEERRLFYVAMTRAKEELYLCSSADYGGKRERKPSVFVLEALEKLRSDMLCLKKSPQEQIELFHPAEELLPAKRLKKNAPLALSFYQIDDYLTCPLKYKYVHLLHVPLLPNQQILVGAAMHQAVAAYALAKKKRQRFTQKDLLAVLKEHWSSEGFISRQHEEARFLASKEALSSFYQREKHNRRNILAVEEGFSLPRHAVILRGRWDRVEEEKGKIYIIDYKSSEIKDQAEADKRARISLQLALYALVAKEKYGKLPEGEELYFLASGIIGKTKKKDEDLQKAEEKIEEVAEGIRKEKFPAIPSAIKCAYCAYGEICPKMIR
jgi:DNA helicase-2/ATP-dependent DNA helicase PcrA